MRNIEDPRLLWAKFVLFILLGMLAAGITMALFPDARLALLLLIAIWAFCRAYYFAFYVVERYIDPAYRFAGLMSFIRYVVNRRRARSGS